MRFDEAAKTWDENPVRTERSILFAERLSSVIKTNTYKKAMDFGAGTGVTSFMLANELEAISLIDYSPGMVEQINEKLKKKDVKHLQAHCVDLLDSQVNFPERYDIIYSLLTLHHILDLSKAIETFYKYLSPGGIICIADLEKEDGSFHEEYPDFEGHNGFDRVELATLFQKAGFDNIEFDHFYTIKKEEQNRQYPLFLLKAKKKA
jgi:ubiquinone/menaquinone biosynthesis C-methylase UbiE